MREYEITAPQGRCLGSHDFDNTACRRCSAVELCKDSQEYRNRFGKTVFVAVAMFDGLVDTVEVFTTKDKANDFLFRVLGGNEQGLYFNDLLEYDPSPHEMMDSPICGTGIFERKIDIQHP